MEFFYVIFFEGGSGIAIIGVLIFLICGISVGLCNIVHSFIIEHQIPIVVIVAVITILFAIMLYKISYSVGGFLVLTQFLCNLIQGLYFITSDYENFIIFIIDAFIYVIITMINAGLCCGSFSLSETNSLPLYIMSIIGFVTLFTFW